VVPSQSLGASADHDPAKLPLRFFLPRPETDDICYRCRAAGLVETLDWRGADAGVACVGPPVFFFF
jgi:hypothetical protein